MNKTPILIAAGILGLFAVGGVGLVAITHELTDEPIAANERAGMLRNVEAKVLGGVLNRVHARSSEYYYYYGSDSGKSKKPFWTQWLSGDGRGRKTRKEVGPDSERDVSV